MPVASTTIPPGLPSANLLIPLNEPRLSLSLRHVDRHGTMAGTPTSFISVRPMTNVYGLDTTDAPPASGQRSGHFPGSG